MYTTTTYIHTQKGRKPYKVRIPPDILATMTGFVSGKRLYGVTETADEEDDV